MILNPRTNWMKYFTLIFRVDRSSELGNSEEPAELRLLTNCTLHQHGLSSGWKNLLFLIVLIFALKSSMFCLLWVFFPWFSPYLSEMLWLSLRSCIEIIFPEKSSMISFLSIPTEFSHTLPKSLFWLAHSYFEMTSLTAPINVSSFVRHCVRCALCLFMTVSLTLF